MIQWTIGLSEDVNYTNAKRGKAFWHCCVVYLLYRAAHCEEIQCNLMTVLFSMYLKFMGPGKLFCKLNLPSRNRDRISSTYVEMV